MDGFNAPPAGGYAPQIGLDELMRSQWDAADEEEIRSTTAGALEVFLAECRTLDDEAKLGLDRYLGKPYGTEMEGFSRHVDRAVLDTVEWILPGLLEIFHGTDETGAFEPVGEEDVAAAEQATDYASYVYNRDNAGFIISHAVIKDALIERLGVWKIDWEDRAKISVSIHTGLDLPALGQIADDPEIEIVAARQYVDGAAARMIAMQGGLPEAALRFDVRIKRTTRRGRIAVEAVPREEYVYNTSARRHDVVDFHAHARLETRSDLISLGYDREKIEALAATRGVSDDRYRRQEASGFEPTLQGIDHDSAAMIDYAECYIECDFDGDGIAEWRKVCLAGVGRELLHQEIVDEPPFVTLTPTLMSHRVEGLSIPDLVADLQALRTDIKRQMIDGLFEVNSPTRKVLLNADEQTRRAVLNWSPGKPIPVKTHDDVQWEAPVWNGAQALPFLEYLDREQQGRTGVSATSTGTNPDLLQNQTAAGLSQLMSAAQQKVNLIARVMAETGFKRVMMRILRLAARRQDHERMVRLRGQWIAMDPRQWNAEMDFVPNVGLGTGDMAQKRAAVGEVLAAQQQVAAAYPQMVGPAQVYNALKELVRASGLPSVQPYFLDPSQVEPMQTEGAQEADPMSDPIAAGAVAAEQVKGQVALTKAQMDDDFRRDKLDAEIALKQAELGATIDERALRAQMAAPRAPIGGGDGAA